MTTITELETRIELLEYYVEVLGLGVASLTKSNLSKELLASSTTSEMEIIANRIRELDEQILKLKVWLDEK